MKFDGAENLLAAVQKIDPVLCRSLDSAFRDLSVFLKSENFQDEQKRRVVSGLFRYVKKQSGANPLLSSSASLREIRNALAHGKVPRGSDFSKHYPALWRAVHRLSRDIDLPSLENLLAYSIGVDNIHLSSDGARGPRFVVDAYKRFFGDASDEDQRRAFTGILMRVLSDSLSDA